ncbi:MAG: hypothetical protein IMY83_04500, partial [Chloroflexi bacterium]|nr:hypothetical protein [Chloroflexota bacterium]
MSYFLISVSNRINLDLCIRHALAGFTNSISGVWTFCEIEEGDFISFLYGAKVFNLYKVKGKRAIKNAGNIPPWPSVTFRMSGRTYFFPFRLILEPLRKFEESMVRPEFAYVAENLLLRGGYRRTHFEADQTTLQSTSQMGSLYDQSPEPLNIDEGDALIPKFTWDRTRVSVPEVFRFHEFILQALLRRYLSNRENLQDVFTCAGLDDLEPRSFEVLGEKALPEGHVDVLVKDRTPRGLSRKIVIEVKSGAVKTQDIRQLSGYVEEIGSECLAGMLIGKNFSGRTLAAAKEKKVSSFVYSFQ